MLRGSCHFVSTSTTTPSPSHSQPIIVRAGFDQRAPDFALVAFEKSHPCSRIIEHRDMPPRCRGRVRGGTAARGVHEHPLTRGACRMNGTLPQYLCTATYGDEAAK